MIGTPFEIKNDEIHNKRVAKKDRRENDEFALNEKGQRRFHGAFTGGFHAGYNNTVGSETGFTPAQYDKNKKITVFDIMDEEDLGDHVHGQTIQTKEGYDTLGETYTKAAKSHLGEGVFAGILPDELVIAPKTSIGYKLLRKLGWNERTRKSQTFQFEEEPESDDSIDFDKMEGIDVSDFVDENIVSAHVDTEKPKVGEREQRRRDKKIKAKLNKSKPVKKPKLSVNSEHYYKGPLKYKNDKQGLGYIPTASDYMIAQKKRESLENDSNNNRLNMGKLNYDGLIYHDDDKDAYDYAENIDNDVIDQNKEKQLEKMFKDKREEK